MHMEKPSTLGVLLTGWEAGRGVEPYRQAAAPPGVPITSSSRMEQVVPTDRPCARRGQSTRKIELEDPIHPAYIHD